MGLPNPLSALPHVLAAALARLRGGDRDSRESPETDAFSPVHDASRLADASDGHRGEDPEDSTRTLDETRAAPPARDGEARCADGTGDRRGGVEDRGATENARTTVRTSHDVRNDDDASASSASSPPSPRPEGAAGVPWDALPEACVQRVFLHAGFRAALCAGATCTSWRRVLDSPHFWKTTFASHFGVGRDDASDFFAPCESNLSGASNVLAPSLRASPEALGDEALFFDWRGAFAEETRAQRRWATGRCVATSSLRAADDSGVNDARTNVAGIAARRGACLVARADGRIATFDLHGGAESFNASWLSDRDDGVTGDGVTGDGDGDGAREIKNRAVACFAFCETSGVCVAGDVGGTLAAYDVKSGARVWRSSTGDDSDGNNFVRPTCLALGAGVAVFGMADGTTRSFYVASGRRLRDVRGATLSSEVTCVAVCDATGFVAAAAGAEVATWPLSSVSSDDVSSRFFDASEDEGSTDDQRADTSRSERPSATWLVGHDEPVRCLRFVEVACRGDVGGIGRGPRTALLTAGDDATTRAWDASSGACVLELEGPPGTTEAEHAGQVPVEWTYTPPPGITALDTWCGLVVEGRADGSVLVWTGALERVSRAMRDRHDAEEAERLRETPSPIRRVEPDAADVDSKRKRPLDATDARAVLSVSSPSRLAKNGEGEAQRHDAVFAAARLGDGSSPSQRVSRASCQKESVSPKEKETTRRNDVPATYRRWWAHADVVTRVVANRGRVVSVSKDGSCHVLALSADTLARAARWKKTFRETDETKRKSEPRSGGGGDPGAFAPVLHNARAGPASPPRRRSADFFETGAAAAAAARGVATRAWRGGEFAGAAAAAAARRTAESLSETSSFASAAAVGSEAWRVADRLSGGLGTNAALAADLAWSVGVVAGASAASAAARAAHAAASVTASAAAETASIAERLGREVGRGASSMSQLVPDAVASSFGVERRRHHTGGFGNETSTKHGLWVFEDGGAAFFPGFGFGGYARGWTFKEHGSAGIECVAVTGQTLITADVQGNVVVRHFGDRAAAAPA